MPKFYFKTFTLSVFLGFLIAVMIIYGANSFTVWLALTLFTAVIINEKLTVRERWRLRHYLLLAILSTIYAVIIALLVGA